MSTRGCVAVVSSDGGWIGVYNHSDSYPTRLAKEDLWPMLAGKSTEELQKFARGLLQAKRFENVREPGLEKVDEDQEPLSSHEPDPLFIEWVYIVNPDKQELRILHHKAKNDHQKKKLLEGEWAVEMGDGYWDYGHCAYRHKEAAKVSLLGPEPHWEEIENKAY